MNYDELRAELATLISASEAAEARLQKALDHRDIATADKGLADRQANAIKLLLRSADEPYDNQ